MCTGILNRVISVETPYTDLVVELISKIYKSWVKPQEVPPGDK